MDSGLRATELRAGGADDHHQLPNPYNHQQGLPREEDDERGVQAILCGMPFLPDGSEGGQVKEVRFFLGALRKRLGEEIPFAEIDERHTTKEAEGMWRQAGFSRKKAKDFLDSTAAVVMLREFLELR